MKTLALIRARQGSVGIPGKNMKLLGGKPLVQWTIDCAKHSGLFDVSDIVVSSDWDLVLDVAKSSGVVPIRRPDTLSDGFARMEEVVDHALSSTGREIPDQIIILNPTSPFRLPDDIVELSQKVERSPKFTGGVSVAEQHFIEMRNISVGPRTYNGFFTNVKKTVANNRQYRRPQIVQNGAIYIVKGEFYKATRQWFGVKNAVHLMPQERSMDIDTIWDWVAAEAYAKEIELRNARPR